MGPFGERRCKAGLGWTREAAAREMREAVNKIPGELRVCGTAFTEDVCMNQGYVT
eukprot:COSAG02_NODE_1228_length_13776_cov_5.546864_4_plen_55_part_00